MYGRATTFNGDPAKIDEAISFIRDTVTPTIQGQSGCLGLGAWCNRETGHVVVVSAWTDRASLDASEATAVPLRAQGGSILGAPASVEIFEPVIIEQTRGDEPGFWSRATMMEGDPSTVDAGIETFRRDVLPAVRGLSGCTGVMLGVNRETGRAIATTTFETRAALDASRDAAMAIRDAAATSTGVRVTDILEDEVVIVGIRGPEIPSPRTIELPTETTV